MSNNSAVKERLFELCSFLQISPDQFSKNIGKNREYVRKITNEISTDVLRRINKKYPEVNILWIIEGKGSMLNQPISANDELTSYLKDRVIKLEEENKKLLIENTLLKIQMDTINSKKQE